MSDVGVPVPFDLYPLPQGFVLAKPLQQEAFSEEEIYKLEREGRLIITRKRDGWKLFVVRTHGQVNIYTDGMRDVTDRLGHIVQESWRQLPDNTLLAMEGLMLDSMKDERGKVTTVLNSAREKSIQAQHAHGLMQLAGFEVIFWAGAYMLSNSYRSRLELLQKTFSRAKYMSAVEVLNVSFDEAKELVRKNNWEGLVLYDKEFVSSYRLDGKAPARPSGCYKWKPILEDDFAVHEWVPSEKNPNRVKELLLTQIDPKTGNRIDCGKLGTFSNAFRERLRHMKYPIVVQVVFEARFPSGKLCNKRLGDMEIREDKKPEDCIAPQSF